MDGVYRRSVESLREVLRARGGAAVYIKTYGCQQNVSDSERIAGMFADAGCSFTELEDEADFLIINTCAVRGSAEDRVFGHLGRLRNKKKSGQILLLGGCMVQQRQIAEKLRGSYPQVDILFNTSNLQKLPELLLARLAGEKAGFFAADAGGFRISEDIRTLRKSGYRALIPIMYGCDNACSYCVVPLVRGAERSRDTERVESDFREAVGSGCRDIMLLGQNVNSYGNNSEGGVNFSALLQRLNAVPGEFTIRFMTSHPKDATIELFDTIAECEKVSRNIHLPAQSGSDRILAMMNRGYTKEQYLSLLAEARRRIPGVTFTGDILIGFPGETKEDFQATAELVREAGFYSLFTFIYSPREGTAASRLADDTPHSEKAGRLIELNKIQDAISETYDRALVGRTMRGIAARATETGGVEVRLDNNSVVIANGAAKIGEYCAVEVTGLQKRRLHGRIAGGGEYAAY